jgi:hypothetical protein
MFHNRIYKIYIEFQNNSKKPLAVAVDQAVLLRGDTGYKVVHEGNVLHP